MADKAATSGSDGPACPCAHAGTSVGPSGLLAVYADTVVPDRFAHPGYTLNPSYEFDPPRSSHMDEKKRRREWFAPSSSAWQFTHRAATWVAPPHNAEIRMATRPIKMPAKEDKEAELPPSTQRKRPETGQFLLQVDRQTKGSYSTMEAATAAGQAIKDGHPVVQVTVYDRVTSATKIISATPK